MKPYCFDIVLPDKLFDPTSPNEKDGTQKFHAHLYAKESSIELRIFFGFNLHTPKFSLCLDNGKFEKAFTKCEVININKENNTKKIDFSKSKIADYSISGNQIEGVLGEYLKINLSSVRIYLTSLKDTPNSADFYLNGVGFDLVKDFYSTLFGHDREFKFSRIQGRDVFYKFNNFEFRPEFDFNYSDVRNETNVIIKKNPKFTLKFPEESNEDDILHCADIVRLIGSFYMHNNIEYYFSRINLKNSTLLIYKSKSKEYRDAEMGLHGFGLNWDFHEFMLSDWQNSAKNNFKLLSKIIPLFVQSMLVDHHSSLLIKYNIIEYCMGNFKIEKEKFPLKLANDEADKEYEAACNHFLETIDSEYHNEFMNKWKFQLIKLKLRPEKSLWNEFMRSKTITLPQTITIENIKTIRDNITHGSLNRIKEADIRKTNILLYGITGVLILDLLGNKEFDLSRIFNKIETI